MYRCQQRVKDGRYTRRCRRPANRINPDRSFRCRPHAHPDAEVLVYDDERELILLVLPAHPGVAHAPARA